MKSYLLLSKNKGSGPYSLEKLLQIPLTPTDLIWIEGESTAWKNASEIYELNELFGGTPGSHVLSLPVTGNGGSSRSSDKEIKKTALKRIYVSLPAGTFKQAVEATTSLEEKAEALRLKVLSFSELKSKDGEVKYSRSLQQMKQEYSDWLQKKKKPHRLRAKAPLFYIIVVLLIPLISFFVLRRQPQKITSTPPLELTLYKNTEPPTVEKKQDVLLKDNATSKTIPVPLNKITENQEASQKQAVAKTETNLLFVNNNVAFNNPSYKTVVTKTPPTGIKKIVNPVGNTPVTSLFETSSQLLKSNEGICLSITFQNISNQIIRSAIIDVFYFDGANKQVGKETLYFGKIEPGKFLTSNASPKEAATASYLVDLVSSEKSGLYVRKKSIL
ncbi:MAG: hypothetical protein M3Y85_04590 [Bacteroidota bacterium]|nr:hypothetical protein [Bacteroidota bacterium]